MLTIERLKLLIICLFLCGGAAALLSGRLGERRALAYSSGPPAGHTGAPGEFTCDECHVTTDAGTGRILIDAPRNYVPGQSYQVSVTQSNADPTRIRWGFQLTAIDDAGQPAGTLAPLDPTTQTLTGQGPFPARQYIEHTSAGTFFGQKGGAVWTFKWTAPPTDVGPVTFHAAGNQANGDGNTSGDNIYFTFTTSTATAPTPDFTLGLTPSARLVTPGQSATYSVTVTPSAGFAGSVELSATGLPAGASASFNPASLSLDGVSAGTSTLTVTTGAQTPLGTIHLNVVAAGGVLQHTATATLVVADPSSADLSVSVTDSPDPAALGANLTYRIVATNHGPAAATGINLTSQLPAGVGFVSATPTQGACAASTSSVNCALGSLPVGASATVDLIVTPRAAGPLNALVNVSGNESDPVPGDNSASATTVVEEPAAAPRMTATNLGVRALVNGLDQPISMAFIGAGDLLVLEKASGRVQHVTGGRVVGTALDLAVNSFSERGLLGIALHPNFAANHFVYLYWTESSTGLDTTAADEVPLLGNRVDRYVWNGSTLTFERTLLRLRAAQSDAGQPARGNHNGGVLRFGPDGKLYVVIGDEGRRGLLQNVTSGGPVPDDQFGGPEPDDAHLTGVILRLNDDGSVPSDNPFFNATTNLTGEAAANVKKIFAYGVRNSFGMDFDPATGDLWEEENGDDSFDEINRVTAGSNNGWVQLMGPSARIGDYKSIETGRPGGLQQNRWPASLIADTPAAALARLYMLPGAHYHEPEFSWKYAVAPAAVGFARGQGLGAQFAGRLFVGASRTTLLDGYLFSLKLSADRRAIISDDPRLADGVADNQDKFDLGESESLVVGRDFGVTTDIQTGPNGDLFVVSLSQGAVYEIFARQTLYVASLDAAQETPATGSAATGTATLLLDKDETTARVSLNFTALAGGETAAHIHGPAAPGVSAAPLFDLPASGSFTDFRITLTPQQVRDLKSGLLYINVHSAAFPAGEIRGQFGAQPAAADSVVQFQPASLKVSEGAGVASFNVVRMGDLSAAASVDYASSDGTASERSDYTTARGTLFFAPGQQSQTISLLLTDDAFKEADETVNLTLTNPTGPLALGPRQTAVLTIQDNDDGPAQPNPIDTDAFFVRQHYHDFLNREPDSAGLQFWTQNIASCGADAQCRDRKRIDTSAAFFLSIEFQETGYLVYRFYKASYGRQPRLVEFLPDTQALGRGVVVGQGDWQAQLEANKQAFAAAWVERPAFKSAFDALSNEQYVDQLYARAGVTPATDERDALVAGLTSGAETRATVLRKVAESAALKRQELNRAFVLMQYFGYLRRNPDDAPDNNLDGYNFWLSKLNQFGGNYVNAEMVKAFISSGEYRGRFGQ